VLLNDAHTFGQKIGFQEKQLVGAEVLADRWNDDISKYHKRKS